jgi:hypothetical protein
MWALLFSTTCFKRKALTVLSVSVTFFKSCLALLQEATRQEDLKHGVRWFSFAGSYKPVTIFWDFVRVAVTAGWKKGRRGLMLP